MEASLRDAHQSKTRFMSATSHDLLQPINAARLFTAALKPQLQHQVDESTRHIVEQIDSSLLRAEQLIAELREISRLDSGRQLPRRSHFPVAEVFDAMEREFGSMASMRGLQLDIQPSSLWLYSDQSLVTRMLQNLLANAIKYTPAGRVVLGARRRAEGAELQVFDTGPGIAEADQVRVFQEFERLQRESRAGEEGLGLGLAIVSRYAQLLGHPLQLRSRQGQGTLFSVTVTYGRVGQKVVTPSDQGVHRDLEGLELLCLDNDQRIREGMQQLLLTMGARVRVAADREQLKAGLAESPGPDVVLADYHLDGDDTGIAAMQAAMASSGRAIPCIIISADDSDVVRDRAKAAGFRFLSKPVNAARLRALVLALNAAGQGAVGKAGA
jgi:CheY-like chemotaxis protein/anti-sigma regulatory factor (Ser/Thr protein kinase)